MGNLLSSDVLTVICNFSHPSDVFGSYARIDKVSMNTVCFMAEKEVFQWREVVTSKSLSFACKAAIRHKFYPLLVVEKLLSVEKRKLFVDDSIMEVFVKHLEVNMVKKLFSREKKYIQIFVQKPRSTFLKYLTDMDLKNNEEKMSKRNEIFRILCRDFFAQYNLRFVRNFMDKFDDSLLEIIFQLPMKNKTAMLNLSDSSQVSKGLWKSGKTKHLLSIVENATSSSDEPTLLSTVHPCPELLIFTITTEKADLLKQYLKKSVVPKLEEMDYRNQYGRNQFIVNLEEMFTRHKLQEDQESSYYEEFDNRFYGLVKQVFDTGFFTVTNHTMLSFVKLPKILELLMKYPSDDGKFDDFVELLTSSPESSKSLPPSVILSVADASLNLENHSSCISSIINLMRVAEFKDLVISHVINFEKIDHLNRKSHPFRRVYRDEKIGTMNRGDVFLFRLLEDIVNISTSEKVVLSHDVRTEVTQKILDLIAEHKLRVITDSVIEKAMGHPSTHLCKKLLEKPELFASLVYENSKCSRVMFKILEHSGKDYEDDEDEGEIEDDKEENKESQHLEKVKLFCNFLMRNKCIDWKIKDKDFRTGMGRLIEFSPFFEFITNHYNPREVDTFTRILRCSVRRGEEGGGDKDKRVLLERKYVQCIVSKMIGENTWRGMYWLYFFDHSKERAKIIQNLIRSGKDTEELKTKIKCSRHEKCKSVLDFSDGEMKWFECFYCTEKKDWKGLVDYGNNSPLQEVRKPKIFCSKCVEEHTGKVRIRMKGMRGRRSYRDVNCFRCLDCKKLEKGEGGKNTQNF